MSNCGKKIRLGRVLDPRTQKSVAVAFDHGLSSGPIAGCIKPQETIAKLVEGGADAILVSPGVARLCADFFVGKSAPALILRLDWTNMFRPGDRLGYKEGRTALIGAVEDAIRFGADAVLTFMFVGYEDPGIEAAEVEKNAMLSRACEAAGIPHIIEPMARGLLANSKRFDAELIRMHVRNAAEIGADAIKTDYSGQKESFASVVEGCPVPILIAGGPKAESTEASLEMVEGAMRAGAVGVLFGRNVFQAADPAKMLKAIRAIVHDDLSAKSAIEKYLA
ncbi:fructose-bisphosphate aldolase, class I [Anaerolineae bacterium]|nr:fructose-bisphosphate aldolase, class I [Anaerolineae bacterium]